MQPVNVSGILVEQSTVESTFLERDVTVDFFLPKNVSNPAAMSLLLINDGQNMQELGLENILNDLYAEEAITPLLCVAIHAGIARKMEYGVASQPDYLGRGDKAGAYTSFVINELLPYLKEHYAIPGFKQRAFAGFSLGALSAMDIVWNHPDLFSTAGIFSGSLWWRSIDQTDPAYDDDHHRIMHQQVRHSEFIPGLRFFFQCGNQDETMDRNNNGIIDSIDDTQDLIKELLHKGYQPDDIEYLELPDGKHDIPTWARAMPAFLKWGWGR